MLTRKIHDLRHFGFGDFIRKDAAFSDSVMVDVKHDLCRRFDILLKKTFQYMNDEFHRRVIVVENKDTIKAGPFDLRLNPGDDGRSRS